MKQMLKAVARVCVALPVAGLFIARAAAAAPAPGDIIINEWNAVGPAATLSGPADPAFANPVGNGGDWVEFVVVNDIDTLVGVRFEWENGDPDAGSLTFVDPGNTGIWDDLEAGTIITIRADSFVPDVSYDPCAGDFTIEFDAFETDYIAMAGHDFKTDNDSWKGRIIIPGGSEVVIQGWVGEPSSGATYQTGSGVGNDEVGKLESDPSDVDTAWNYNDGDCSSYGAPNCWNEGGSSFTQNDNGWFDDARSAIDLWVCE